MSEESIVRIELVKEATEIEAAGGDWRMRHVLAVLDCHRATLYRPRYQWIMARAIHGPGGLSFRPADVRLFQANHTGSALARRRA